MSRFLPVPSVACNRRRPPVVIAAVTMWVALCTAPGAMSLAVAQEASWISPEEHQRVIMPRLSAEASPVVQRPARLSNAPARESVTGTVAATAAEQLLHKPARLPARGRMTPEMKDMLQRASQHFAVDAHLVMAVIHAESAFNPRAVSPKNAIGLMQVLPSTARDLGLQELQGKSVEQLMVDPRVSIVLGTKYLAEQLARFNGNVELAVAAYNAGPGAVVKAGLRVPNYPETQQYVRRVLSLARSYQQGEPA